MKQHLAFIEELVGKGGPDVADYPRLEAWLHQVGEEAQSGELTPAQIQELKNAFGEALSLETLQGFSLAKPHGYTGDFEIIDKMYQRHLSDKAHLRKWDEFFHAAPSVKAVRNRKAYFLALLERLHDTVQANTAVLDVASGPGRDISEFLAAHPDTPLRFECVEKSPQAIAYATNLCRAFLHKVTFHEANAFFFETENRFQLVWSAGLFDYFEDKHFKILLQHLYSMVESGGELVIGNFSDNNRSQNYMEVIGEWFLQHRSREHLIELAQECGIERALIRVGEEPEGVNLFMHIKKP